VIIPFGSFAVSAASCAANIICMAFGIIAALALDRFNRRVECRLSDGKEA
jgi:putative membrane protein